MQSKKQSIIESIWQTIIGLATSIVIQLMLYPAMGIPVTFSQNVIITFVFFVVSIFRGYLVRRFFNKKKYFKKNQEVRWLHCFECEIETPVKEIDGIKSCKNCGLVHSEYYC